MKTVEKEIKSNKAKNQNLHVLVNTGTLLLLFGEYFQNASELNSRLSLIRRTFHDLGPNADVKTWRFNRMMWMEEKLIFSNSFKRPFLASPFVQRLKMKQNYGMFLLLKKTKIKICILY